MANGRIRIGYPSPTNRLLAEMGSYSLAGQIALLLYDAADSAFYSYIDSPVGYTDHWVYNGSTTGTGTEGSPYTLNQMLTFPISGGRHRFILKPGQYSITAVASDSKMPVLDPTNSGTAANPVIVTAQFSATKASTTAEQLTVFRRTAGAGSILGTAGGADYWLWDGFKMAGSHGGGGNENAHIVLRSCVGWEFTRFWIDDEFDSFVPFIPCPGAGCNDGSTNGGGVFIQASSQIFVSDFIIENLGQAGGGNLVVWQPIEMYESTDVEVQYGTIRNIWGIGVHMKGYQGFAHFQRCNIHHLLLDNCQDGGLNPYVVQAGTNPANHNYWWNIIVKNSQNHAAEFNFIENAGLGLVAHQGTHFQNITFVNTTNSSILVRPAQYTQYISVRNCVMDDSPKHLEFLDALYPSTGGIPDDGYGNEQIAFDYNRYNNGNIMESGSGTDTNLTAWRLRSVWDDNSDDTPHTYVNAPGGNFLTHSSVPANRPDTHNRYGGANVRPGAWEEVGHRDTL